MKKLFLIILLFLVVGCRPLRFYPGDGAYGSQGWKMKLGKKVRCDICHKETELFKIDNKGRVWGKDCYRRKILGETK